MVELVWTGQQGLAEKRRQKEEEVSSSQWEAVNRLENTETQDTSGVPWPKVLYPVSCDGARQGLGEWRKGWNLDEDVA